jgi:WD40 repeat protein
VPSPQDSQPEQAPKERRYLIAAGTSHYKNLGADCELPAVKDDIRRIVELFTARLGYQRVLPELENDPTTEQLRSALSRWFVDRDREATDIVVLYFAGHGASGTAQHYLLASDSEEKNFVGTALPTRELASLLSQSPVRQFLILLDTCYSGEGIKEFSSVAAELLGVLAESDLMPTNVWAIAAARPREEASEGAFAEAVVEAIKRPGIRYAGSSQYLSIDAIVHLVNQRFRERSLALERTFQHKLKQHALGSSPRFESVAPFIRNPHCRPDLPAGVDVETQRRLRRLRPEEVVSHWGPRARGVEIESQHGWYFTGRTAVLRELVQYLTSRGLKKAEIITGSPGCGKSAVLARLVTLSDPEYRRKMPLDDVPEELIPPAGTIDVAINAKGMTLEDVLCLLAAAAGLKESSAELFVSALARNDKEFVVVVDALDEAKQPKEIARELLAKLAGLSWVRLIVGTRKEYLKALGPSVVVLDLDEPAFIDHLDVAEYVTRRLLAEDDPESPTPYRNRRELVLGIAARAAERVSPNFLVARLVSQSLIHAAEPLDVRPEDWLERLPSTVDDALDADLGRFGPDKVRVCDLLRPLAYAEGVGLPWENLWALLASVISGRAYTDSDVEWLLDNAGSYVVEGAEQGRPVYRLFHQALNEHLQRRGREVEVQRRFTKALIEQTPVIEPGKRRNWLRAYPYILRHLAAHAAAARMLSELIKDALYVLAADQDRLYVALTSTVEQVPREIVHTYESAFHHLVTKPINEAAAYLEMIARQGGDDEFADAITRLPLKRAWSVSWANWRDITTHRVIGRHESGVCGLALAELDNRQVLISCGRDRTVRLWDLTTSKSIGGTLSAHTHWVKAVAAGKFEDRGVIVSGSADNTVRLWDLATGISVGPPLTGHTSSVEAVALGLIEGRSVIVSGSRDGTVRVWDLAGGKPVGPPLTGHTEWVLAVAVGQFDGRWVIVSGSRDGTMRVWDLAGGKPVGQPLTGLAQGEWVRAVALTRLEGRPVIISGNSDHTVRVWDLAGRRPIGQPFSGHTKSVDAVAVGKLENREVIVSGSADNTVRLWDLATGLSVGPPLTGHTGSVEAVSVAQFDGHPIIVSGSSDDTLRVWNLVGGRPARNPVTLSDEGVFAAAVVQIEHHSMVMSGGGDGALRRWDLATGKAIKQPLFGHTQRVTGVARAQLHGRPVVVSSSRDGTLRVWNLVAGTPIGRPITGHADWVPTWNLARLLPTSSVVSTEPTNWVMDVAVGHLEGHPVIVSAGRDATVRIWDLATGDPIGKPLRGHKSYVGHVAVGQLEGRAVIVSGGETIRLWHLATGKPLWERTLRDTRSGKRESITALAVEQLGGTSVIICGGWEGSVQVWNLADGNPIGEPLCGHTSYVNAVTVGEMQDRPVIISGAADATLRVWDSPDAGGIQRIKIDAGQQIRAIAPCSPSEFVVGGAMGLMTIRLAP